MARIVGGVAGGRRIATPPGRGTRPTADRVREALFSALESARGSLSGAAFLDLYAGTGAVGLEAASRGASPVVLVERQARALTALRANVAALDLPGVAVRAESVDRFLQEPASTSFDVVYIDPPYVQPVDGVLAALAVGWLAADASVVVERSADDAPVFPDGFDVATPRRYGDTSLWYALWYGRRP